MRKTPLAFALLLAVAAVWAGDKTDKVEKSKCPYDTQSCLNYMSSKLKTSGWIGVELERGASENFVVKKVVAGSPAESAGLQVGDELLALDGVPMNAENDKKIGEMRQGMKPGTKVTYTIRRAAASKDVTFTLGSWPADLVARYIGEHMLEHAGSTVASSGK